MKPLDENLTKVVKDILHYDNANAIEKIIKTVFETIMNLERNEYLRENKVPGNKGNGYYERLVRAVNDYIKLKVPRDRLALFKPVFLESIQKLDTQMQDLAFQMYTYGLTTRDIGKILNNIFGKKMSASSVSNITKEFEPIRKAWLDRPLEEEYYFIYIDAIWVATRRDTVQKEAYYVAIGLRKDFKRDILGVYNIPTESASGWEVVLADLKRRGVKKASMVIADGITSLENAIQRVFPGTRLQKCLLHKVKNIMKNVRSSDKAEIAKDFFQNVFILEDQNYTREKAEENLETFIEKWSKIYPSIRNKLIKEHYDYYFAYLNYPAKIHRMIYTTNWVERLNKVIRKTEKVRNSFPNPDSALNLICAMLMEFEKDVYRYPVTSFLSVQDELDDLLKDGL